MTRWLPPLIHVIEFTSRLLTNDKERIESGYVFPSISTKTEDTHCHNMRHHPGFAFADSTHTKRSLRGRSHSHIRRNGCG